MCPQDETRGEIHSLSYKFSPAFPVSNAEPSNLGYKTRTDGHNFIEAPITRSSSTNVLHYIQQPCSDPAHSYPSAI